MITFIDHFVRDRFPSNPALFASYAIQGKPPIRWIVDGLEVIESDTIDQYIKSTRESWVPFYQMDKKIFLIYQMIATK